jgi:hypothetical protein
MNHGRPPRRLEDVEKDLQAAEAEHTRLSRLLENYSGNNPSKYRSSLRTAAGRVRYMRELLKKLRAG